MTRLGRAKLALVLAELDEGTAPSTEAMIDGGEYRRFDDSARSYIELPSTLATAGICSGGASGVRYFLV